MGIQQRHERAHAEADVRCLRSAAFLQTLNRMVGDEHSSEEAVRESLRLTGAIEDHPEPVRDALMKWMREKQCQLPRLTRP